MAVISPGFKPLTSCTIRLFYICTYTSTKPPDVTEIYTQTPNFPPESFIVTGSINVIIKATSSRIGTPTGDWTLAEKKSLYV